ncbi:MAG: NAD(P)H-hydrate dehydratase [Oscillospiraceae bacterium]|nr:NAD(P)H-hydrate dehydratase [Oscillospiraceae bacterium]
MILCSSGKMREIDRRAIADMGVAESLLMSNAAAHVATAAIEHLPLGGSAAVFCGTGNNGGDGFGAAAYLLEKGVPVRVFLVGNGEKMTQISKEMEARFIALGGVTEAFTNSDDIWEYVDECDVLIDAIVGIGLVSQLRTETQLAVELINASKAFIISVDISSGVNADTGEIHGIAVEADLCVTFTLAKPGHFIEPGCVVRGELRTCDIGIPQSIINSVLTADSFAVGAEDIKLPPRRADSHKGDYGRLFVLAGSVGYTGAPVLSARAASKMGTGLVFLAVPTDIYGIIAGKLIEEMPFPLPSDDAGRLAGSAADEILLYSQQCDVSLIGPGLGRSPDITDMLISLIPKIETSLVLDADGLNAISDNVAILQKSTANMILTPHPGEFARLGGDLSAKDRLSAAKDFAKEYNCILVLKGHRTITAFPDGTAYINTTGGPAMAKGGSGDVLAGMIAALICQKFPIKEAVITAVYLHGKAGDLCAQEFGEYSVVASDIINMIPKAVKSLQ